MLVLHVGPHKTATTWLQYNFHHNIKALERAGWYYPQTGVRVRVAHHDVSDNPDEILDDRSAKVRELRRIAEKARRKNLNILMSSEGFRHWKPAHIAKLQAIMAPHALHIVYCVRDPASILYSFWAQNVQAGKPEGSFPEFSGGQFARAAHSRLLNPLGEIRRFAECEGASLSILLYDEIRRQKRDIFDVFVEDILKIEPLPHSSKARANDRQPIEMTEFTRLVLERVGPWRDNTEASIGRVFQYLLPKAKQQRIIEAVAAVVAARRTLVIDRKHPIFRKVQARLLKDYRPLMVPQPAGRRLFLDGPEECVYYDSELLLQDSDVTALLDRVADTFRPDGYYIRVVNRSRFWLSFYRRAMKLLRR